MKTLSILFCAAALVLAPAAGGAQSAPPAPSADDGQRQALAERYFRAVHLDAQVRRLVDTLTPMMMNQVLASKSDLTDAQRAKISDAVRQGTLDGLAEIQPDYDRGVTRLVASTYSTEELTAMVDFYEAPIGQSILAKQSQMMAPMSQVMMGLMPRLQQVIKQRVCERLGCGVPAASGAHGPA